MWAVTQIMVESLCERRQSFDCVKSTVLELMVVAVRERMAALLSVQM